MREIDDVINEIYTEAVESGLVSVGGEDLPPIKYTLQVVHDSEGHYIIYE